MSKLNLESWEYDKPVPELRMDPQTGKDVEIFAGKTEKADFDVTGTLSDMLRSPGALEDMADTCEAIMLGRKLQDFQEEEIELDKRQIEVLKKIIDRFIKATFEGQARFGGVAHEELILRINSL